MPLFDAAFAAPNKGTAILYSFKSINSVIFLQKIVNYKNFSRPESKFPVLFKALFV